MARLVVVVPLKEGSQEEARRLLADGPPMDLESSRFTSHQVFLTGDEVVFVFETPEDVPATLDLRAGDPSLWRAAASWRGVMAGRPRVADTVFAWSRE